MVLGQEVKVFQYIDQIGRDSIDLIADDPFFTYEWFKTLETQRSFGNSPFYLAVYDEGKVIAVAPCFVDLTDNYFSSGPPVRYVMPFLKEILNFGKRVGFCQEHILLCYAPSCGRTKILMAKNTSEKHILNLLVEKIDSICKAQRILFSSFLFVSEQDELLMNNLESLSFHKSPGIITFYLDVQWSNFEDYIKTLNKKNRNTVRREIKKCAENGITIEESEVGDRSAKLSELLSNLTLKYDKNSTSFLSPDFFSKLNDYAKNKTKLFVAKKNSEVVGFSLILRQGDVLDVWMAGFKYDIQTNTDFTYFNLCYYAPIQWAIRVGIKKMYYRSKAEKVKLDRGCKPEKTYSFLKCHDEVLGPLINNALKTPLYSYMSRRLTKRIP